MKGSRERDKKKKRTRFEHSTHASSINVPLYHIMCHSFDVYGLDQCVDEVIPSFLPIYCSRTHTHTHIFMDCSPFFLDLQFKSFVLYFRMGTDIQFIHNRLLCVRGQYVSMRMMTKWTLWNPLHLINMTCATSNKIDPDRNSVLHLKIARRTVHA